MDIKVPLGATRLSGLGQTVLQLSGLERTCYSSQRNQCYSSILFRRQQENPSSRREGTLIQRHQEKSTPSRRRGRERENECTHAWEKEREPFGSSFYVFSSPGPALCKVGLIRSAVLLEVLTPVLGPSFVLFLWGFPFLVFQPPPFWTSSPYSNYLTVFNKSGQCLFSPDMQKFRTPMENCLTTQSYNNLYLPETLQHQKVLEIIFILVLSILKDISEKRLSDRGQKTFSIKDQVVKIIKFACHAISISTTLLKHLAAIDNNKSSVTIQLHLQVLKFKFYVILQVMKYIPF